MHADIWTRRLQAPATAMAKRGARHARQPRRTGAAGRLRQTVARDVADAVLLARAGMWQLETDKGGWPDSRTRALGLILYTDIDPACCACSRRVADRSLPAGDVLCARRADAHGGTARARVRAGASVLRHRRLAMGLKVGEVAAEVAIVTGSFPCQDIISARAAGAGAGQGGGACTGSFCD